MNCKNYYVSELSQLYFCSFVVSVRNEKTRLEIVAFVEVKK